MPNAHRATRRAKSRLSPVWIVPLVAVLIGLWLVYDNYAKRGPQVVLEMPSAEGIEAGKTQIKTLNVQVGRVESVRLSEDMTHTLVTARMSPDAERMLNEESRFWVVKPRIGREGISGLNTVLSGAYIQLQPGNSEQRKYEFTILEQPPVAPQGAEGMRINLTSQVSDSLSVGDPVTYQGYTVGRVEATDFNPETREMHHRLFIESPYDVLITESTRFWSPMGIDMRLDSQGFRVNVASLETLLGGGVTFGIPADVPMGPKATEDATYQLYDDEESALQGTFSRYLEYVLLIDDTVRGLSQGSPVEYRGVRIGTVASVPWNFSAPQPDTLERFAIPVLIRIEPQRLGNEEASIDLDEWRQRFEKMFDYGLRATLKSGNLLTGALFVDLNFHQDDDTYEAMTFEQRPVFPTTSSGFAQLEQKLSNLLDKLNAVEIEPILGQLDRNLVASESMLEEVRNATESLRTLLEDPATREVPHNINQSLRELRQTLEGLSPESQAYQELTRTLQGLEKLMRELQPVARTLSEQPNALIFDRRDSDDPIPRAPNQGDK